MIVYNDKETKISVRLLDLNKTDDIKLFIRANESFVNELKNQPLFPTTDPFESQFWSVYSEIAYGMRIERDNPYEKGYVLLSNSNIVGTGWVSKYTVGLGWKPPRLEFESYYPVVTGYELSSPWSRMTMKLYYVMTRMLRAKGYTNVYCVRYTIHPIYKQLKIKREIGIVNGYTSLCEMI